MEVHSSLSKKYLFESHLMIVLEISKLPKSCSSQYLKGFHALANPRIGIGIASCEPTILSPSLIDLYQRHL